MKRSTKQATIAIDADLLQEIESLALDRQLPFDDVIADALRQYIEELKRDEARQRALALLDELRASRPPVAMDDDDVYKMVYDELRLMRDESPQP